MTATPIADLGRTTRSFGWWTRRLALGGLTLFAALSVGYGGFALAAKHQLQAQNPPAGQLVDVGGYRIHLHCTGEANGPTVLLEAGNADFSVHWALVQAEVAQFARVCAYDRAGLGWSDPSPRPRTTAAMVEELEATLAGADVTGPLILVGHSFGAIVIRHFADRNPNRVAAMVLVDPAHEQQMERIPPLRQAVKDGAKQFEALAPLADLGLLALLPGSVPRRGLPPEAHAQYVAVLATTDYFRAAAKETAALSTNLQPAAMPTRNYELPLVIVSRGVSDSSVPVPAGAALEVEKQWMELQLEQLTLSANSNHVVAKRSGHDIHLQQPDLLAEIVAHLLEYTRGS